MLHQLLIRLKQPFIKLVPVPTPECWSGHGETNRIIEGLHKYQCQKPLVVSDKALTELGLIGELTSVLDTAGVNYELFDEVEPDPGFDTVNNGIKHFREAGCDSLIAFGGGSVMDCGKAILGCVATGKSIDRLPGLMTVRKKLPTMIAIPTTAGTGSEATIAAVVTNKAAKQKLAITDPTLVPELAILDASLMTGLPRHITAATGVDALTHAIEAYLSLYADNFTRQQSIEAVQKIFKHLPTAYQHGDDLEAREAMARASYQAGVAFTRTYIGYVHAIAHQLGGIYHIPHGLANAMLLVKVLEYSFDKCESELASLARTCDLANDSDNDFTAATRFLNEVKALLNKLDIPQSIKELKAADIELISKRAIKEAYGVYPVPKEMQVSDCKVLLRSLLPATA